MTLETLVFTSIYKSHHQKLIWFLSRLLKCESAAEEVSQEAYMKFFVCSDDIVIQNPRAYLFRIAKNIAIDRLIKEKTERRFRSIEEPVEIYSETSTSPEPLPDQIVAAQKRYEAMANALNELPRACREGFVMNKINGVTYEQIAAELGISISMVEKHLMRAMRHCRERLREHDQ